MTLNLVRQGVLGEVLHAEAGYLHDLRGVKFANEGEGLWRRAWAQKLNGNLYPTHGLGPVAQCLNINRGDAFDYIVSMSCPSRGLHEYAVEHVRRPTSPAGARRRTLLGDVNTSLIRTKLGKTIILIHDTNLPRPLHPHQPGPGDQGHRPQDGRIGSTSRAWPTSRTAWDDFEKFAAEYEHPLWKAIAAKGEGRGHGGMDYIEDYRLVQSLLQGRAARPGRLRRRGLERHRRGQRRERRGQEPRRSTSPTSRAGSGRPTRPSGSSRPEPSFLPIALDKPRLPAYNETVKTKRVSKVSPPVRAAGEAADRGGRGRPGRVLAAAHALFLERGFAGDDRRRHRRRARHQQGHPVPDVPEQGGHPAGRRPPGHGGGPGRRRVHPPRRLARLRRAAWPPCSATSEARSPASGRSSPSDIQRAALGLAGGPRVPPGQDPQELPPHPRVGPPRRLLPVRRRCRPPAADVPRARPAGWSRPRRSAAAGRSPADLFGSVIKVFFQGILTDKGRGDFAAATPGPVRAPQGGPHMNRKLAMLGLAVLAGWACSNRTGARPHRRLGHRSRPSRSASPPRSPGQILALAVEEGARVEAGAGPGDRSTTPPSTSSSARPRPACPWPKPSWPCSSNGARAEDIQQARGRPAPGRGRPQGRLGRRRPDARTGRRTGSVTPKQRDDAEARPDRRRSPAAAGGRGPAQDRAAGPARGDPGGRGPGRPGPRRPPTCWPRRSPTATVIAPAGGVVTHKAVEAGETGHARARPWSPWPTSTRVHVMIYVTEGRPGPGPARRPGRGPIDAFPEPRLRRAGSPTSRPRPSSRPRTSRPRDERVKLVYRVKVELDNADGAAQARHAGRRASPRRPGGRA
ncbi:MAG: hypothetical protein MZV63_72525 [Marinilabiliales bacterium]|nr:hypothetical protein [Marinilabiliales bacterium]